ncbi:diaminopimelate epimerase [Brevibacterium sp.]|uniref:diaminopimelate epimerase n=1 Tax=Brevibacterium sp. TaxID=1701 RepID=UPI002812588A|nr:diaminopimelate epimerase [Brevibacterium sp.]
MNFPDSPFADISGTVFYKGHGTQNDFVFLADDDGQLTLRTDTIAALADRRVGLGADGIIRVVRSEVSGIPGALDQAQAGAEWYMDYYNHDGSVSEMCGNGVRAFAHTLIETGRVPAEADEIRVATRDGIKTVRRVTNPTETADSWYEIDMGTWSLDDDPVLVTTAGIDVARPGLSVETGNPHTVVALAEFAELESADLRDAPALDPVPANGSNIEYIVMEPARSDIAGGEGALKMRVFERGVGETRSCGTGACAAAIAAHHWAGAQSPVQWRVDVPGGQLRIGITIAEAENRGTVTLAGPAVIVATGAIG